jgi:hypothetical protein
VSFRSSSKCLIINCSVFFHHKSHFWHQFVTCRGFFSRRKSISVPKTQHSTVKYSQPFSKHVARDVQHELTFLQSVTLQTQVRAQPLRSSGTNSHLCNQEASRHIRTIHRPL